MASRFRESIKSSGDVVYALQKVLLEKLGELEEDIVLDPSPSGVIRLRVKTQNWQHVDIKIKPR